MQNDPANPLPVAVRAPLPAKKRVPLWAWIVGGIGAFVVAVLLLCVALPGVIGLGYMIFTTQPRRAAVQKPNVQIANEKPSSPSIVGEWQPIGKLGHWIFKADGSGSPYRWSMEKGKDSVCNLEMLGMVSQYHVKIDGDEMTLLPTEKNKNAPDLFFRRIK
jgi:hypothetical protein